MGPTATLFANIILPATIAGLFFLFLSFVLVPLWQRYRGRYSRYLPVDTISAQTSGFRERIQDAIGRWILPSRWRADFEASQHTVNAGEGSEHGFDDDDGGEELYELHGNRREALSLDARRGQGLDGARLSRDLEAGFADDSDDDSTDARAAASRRS